MAALTLVADMAIRPDRLAAAGQELGKLVENESADGYANAH
jgi:hypothetical protein